MVENNEETKYENLEDIPGVGPATAEKMRELGIHTVESLATATIKELSLLGLGEKQASKIINEARNCIALTFIRADELMKMRQNVLKLTTGSKSFDKLIGGGIEGYLVKIGRVEFWARPLLAIAGGLIAFPEWMSSCIGVVLALIVIGIVLTRRKTAAEKITASE